MAKRDPNKSADSTIDGWFAKHEEELLRQARRERKRKLDAAAAVEREELRKLHWMKCPKCGHDLVEESIGTVTIDRCGRCEGIFLDRGELEEILLGHAGERRSVFRRILGLGGD
jgi:hypothetical protein